MNKQTFPIWFFFPIQVLIKTSCEWSTKVFESCDRVVVVCGAFGLLPAFLAGIGCTVGIDRDPPMCLDAQGGIEAKRQPLLWLVFS